MSGVEKVAMWMTIGFIAIAFIVFFGTFYIAAKDLWETYVENKRSGKHGRE